MLDIQIGCRFKKAGSMQGVFNVMHDNITVVGIKTRGKLCQQSGRQALLAVITAVWIGVLGFGQMHVIEQVV